LVHERIPQLLRQILWGEWRQMIQIKLGLMSQVIADRLNREALRRIDGLACGTELSHAHQGRQTGTRRGLIRLQDKLHRATQQWLPWD